jgi:ferredoxin
MRVWIDPDECTGAGTCGQVAPEVFHARADGAWAVKEQPPYFDRSVIFDGGSGPGHGPEGSAGLARVPSALSEVVLDAAEQCRAECIYLEV